jgi:hypothetical protein
VAAGAVLGQAGKASSKRTMDKGLGQRGGPTWGRPSLWVRRYLVPRLLFGIRTFNINDVHFLAKMKGDGRSVPPV